MDRIHNAQNILFDGLEEKSKVRHPVHHSPEHLGCLAVREVLALLEVPGKKRKKKRGHFRNLIINTEIDYVIYLS